MKYTETRAEILETLTNALAALEQQQEDDYNPYEWGGGTRFGVISEIPDRAYTAARARAKKIVQGYERMYLWPPERQDLGLFVDAASDVIREPENQFGAEDLALALALNEFDYEERMNERELASLEALQVAMSRFEMEDEGSGQRPDFAVWAPHNSIEEIRITTHRTGAGVLKVELTDGRVLSVADHGNATVPAMMNRLRNGLPAGTRVVVDGATTYGGDPSYDAIVAHYMDRLRANIEIEEERRIFRDDDE